jgi:hypothetical protein
MLVDALRDRLADPSAPSFRLMGEDLQLLTLEDIRRQLPDKIDPELAAEERALAIDAHSWLRKYNRSLHGRVIGYVELGRRCEFRYPWPVVAILGIVQVMTGMDRARVYGLVGRLAARVGYRFLEQLGDASEDILRRTNRGIFADSVPTVLRAIRAHALRREGKAELASALIEGQAALLWDGESALLCKRIADGLDITEPEAQFRALADTTVRHFDREQAIFTHHIASRNKSRKLPSAKTIPAPKVSKGKLMFEGYPLPPGFDLRDHGPRVEVFAEAFVHSVTRTRAEYGIARDYVLARFGSR